MYPQITLMTTIMCIIQMTIQIVPPLMMEHNASPIPTIIQTGHQEILILITETDIILILIRIFLTQEQHVTKEHKRVLKKNSTLIIMVKI